MLNIFPDFEILLDGQIDQFDTDIVDPLTAAIENLSDQIIGSDLLGPVNDTNLPPDTIGGFEDNIDTIAIALALVGTQSVADLLADNAITNQVGASVVMDFGGGDILRINNVGVADLADDVVFV